MKNQLAACLVAFVTACTSAGVESDPISQGANPGSAAGTCAEPEGPIHNYNTAGELTALVVGQWVRCSGPDLLQSPQNGGVGIEFDADGTYHVLASDGAGGVITENGFNYQGTWIAEPPPDNAVLTLVPATGGRTDFDLTFEDSPQKFAVNISLGIDNESIYASAH
jgi:hypothetical protein